MDIKEIETLKRKIETINQTINEKKASSKLLKEQLAKKLQELKALGIGELESADEHIQELENKYNALKTKIEKAISHAESQLTTEDEIF